MGELHGFLKYNRSEAGYRSKDERVKDYKEVLKMLEIPEIRVQAARCMDCGTPFCHSIGCPVGNLIPEWNDLIYNGQWKEAWLRLEKTNNFPEITGRICPAPCETSCTLAINDAPVSIKQIELAIAEKAFDKGWVIPRKPEVETGKKIAVIGSGPAGLASSQQLRRMGHSVTLFEKDQKLGGLLRYGIPDFKLDKSVIDRRLVQMEAEGVEFETGVTVGEDISMNYLKAKFDAILITTGAGTPRDLPVEGRELEGVHFAMEFLSANTDKVNGVDNDQFISAKGKNVVVIGGGDTGSDCVGTSNRHGANKIYQFEIMPKPLDWKEDRNPSWPDWPIILRTSSSHLEGCERDWNILTKSFEGKDGKVTKGKFARIEWVPVEGGGRPQMKEIPGSEFILDIDLAFLAMGFVHTDHYPIVEKSGLKTDGRGNIAVEGYATSEAGVFAAGDSHSGASLVVRAINHGRNAAQEIDQYLNQ